MAVKNLPPAERLRQLFKYDPETGVLTWNSRPLSDFRGIPMQARFESLCAGRPAGARAVKRRKTGNVPSGVVVKIDSIAFMAHRIIWTMVSGSIPNGMQVDHRNMNPYDNRLDNLRLATHAQNKQNNSIRRDSTVGFKGVTRMGGKFQATISVNNNRIHLGTFATAEQASQAYQSAAIEYHGEFARLE